MVAPKSMLITLIVLFSILILTSTSSAQDTLLINYQGRLTDDGGNPVTGTPSITFTIYSGEGASQWTESHSSVQVENGLFNVILGSETALPKTVFSGEDRYLGIEVAGNPELSPRTLFTYAPYAAHAMHSDTADYAHASPGGASTGWVNDGSVVRLQDSNDNVGIGVTDPSEPLVIGKDIADYPGDWLVIGDDTPDETTGLIIGEDVNNQSWLEWRIDSNYLTIGSVESNTDHSYTLNLHGGRVGIKCTDPSEPLVVGKNLTSYPGTYVVIGNDTPGENSGLMVGEDQGTHGWLKWSTDGDRLVLGTREDWNYYDHTISLTGGNVGINCANPSEPLVVGKDLGPFYSDHIVIGKETTDEYFGLMIGTSEANRCWMQWHQGGQYMQMGTKENGSTYHPTLVMKQNRIGIGTTDPGENLVVGDDLGSFGGNRISIGDSDAGVNVGLNIGKDSNNRSWITWNTTNNDGLKIGTKENGTNYGTVLSIGGGTVDVPDNAISDNEILDEPGVAREAKSNNIEVGYSWTTICSRTCNFPTSGFAVVLLTCEYQNRTEWRHFTFGITDNSGAAPRLYTQYIEYIPDSPNGEYWGTFSMHEVFAVGAGNNTFSFLAKKVEESFPVYTWDVSITVMFFPTAYGTVATATEGDNGELGNLNTSAQPMLFTSDDLPPAGEATEPDTEQLANTVVELQLELQLLREEVERLKKER